MVSRDQCNAGGTHFFDEPFADVSGIEHIVHVLRCSKCREVCKREISVKANTFTYENCDSNECKGSSDGHDWNFDQHDYTSGDEGDMDSCTHCNGERRLGYNHNRTEYTGPDGIL